MKIKWQDDAGREFAITAPLGDLSFSMLQGDNLSYNSLGKVIQVGTVYISYNSLGQVIQVGTVYISYNSLGTVIQVGLLYVKYDSLGRITGTSGSVN
jgi:hypothetical protein